MYLYELFGLLIISSIVWFIILDVFFNLDFIFDGVFFCWLFV